MKSQKISVPLTQLEDVLRKYIVPLAKPGAILLLRGQLGAGKTTLVKALMRQIGIIDEISSPTFSYVNSYKNNGTLLTVHHFDLYRLNSVDEFIMQGFDELLQQKDALAIIEWPEILNSFFEQEQGQVKDIFYIDLEHNFTQQETRDLTITSVKSFLK